VIVEPVFRPHEMRFTATLDAVAGLDPIAKGTLTPCLIVRSDDAAPPASDFQRDCQLYLPRRLVPGASIEVLFVEQMQGGERLHNRFVITDVGSVLLGDSIDEGIRGETNDLALLDEDHHRARLATYGNAETAFHVVGRFRISGAKGSKV
jgi:hypothetical protein